MALSCGPLSKEFGPCWASDLNSNFGFGRVRPTSPIYGLWLHQCALGGGGGSLVNNAKRHTIEKSANMFRINLLFAYLKSKKQMLSAHGIRVQERE